MKLKKTIMSIFALAATGLIITPIATSCSDVSSDIIDNLVDKGENADKFSSVGEEGDNKTSLKQVFTEALKTKTGFNAFKSKLVDDVLYDWYKSKIDDKNPTFKDNWKKWEKDAKKDYDDKVSSYKDSHRNDWPYYFQNEVLDPVGGTKDAYIRDKICQSVRTEFTDLVFATDDLKLPANYAQEDYKYDERNEIWNGTTSNTFDNSSTWSKMDFFSSADPLYLSIPALANQYAKIQKYVFNQYMKVVRPVSTAMCLWKYSAPKGSMEDVYNKDTIPSSGGGSDTNDDTKGITVSYEYPFFTQPGSPIGSDKTVSNTYFDFTTQWKSKLASGELPFIDKDDQKINIPKEFSEDSATLMITESKTAFSSLDVYFAGAVSDLWSAYGTGNVDSEHLKNDYFNNGLVTPDSLENVDILDNFFFRNDSTKKDQTFGAYSLDLSKQFAYTGTGTDTITNFSSALFNPYGVYAAHNGVEGVRYVVPAVRLTAKAAGSTENTALPMILIRDTFGVHLIGLDCAKYIASYKDSAGKVNQWEAESNVLKYRSLMESYNFGNQGTGMTLNSKLKDYFKNNLDDLVLGMLKDGWTAYSGSEKDAVEKEIFNKDVWNDKDNLNKILDLVSAGNQYYNYYDLVNTIDEANKKLFDTSSKYVTNNLLRKNGQITTDVYKNGVANCLPFTIVSGIVGGSSGSFNSASSLFMSNTHYEPIKLVYGYDDDYLAGPHSMVDRITKNFLDSLLNDLTAKTDAYWNWSNPTGNASKDGSLKYSEHIFVNRGTDDTNDEKTHDAINFVYNAFGGSGSDMSNIIKYNAYNDYLSLGDDKFSESDFDNALTSIYKTDKVISDSTPLSYYNNSELPTASSYKNLVNQAYNATSWKSITTNAQTFSSDSLNYQLTLATLHWLTKNNYKQLFTQLRNTIPDFSSAAIVWAEKDLIPYNKDFTYACKTTGAAQTASYDKIFGFQSNYLGKFDKTYQSTNVDKEGHPYDDAVTSGFISNPYYYHFAPLPYTTTGTESTPSTMATLDMGMGFVGIQTSSSSPELDSEVSDIIFSRNNKHLYNSVQNATTDQLGTKGEGSLYQYGSKANLKGLIQDNHSIESIKSYALAIENAIPYNPNFEVIISQIKNGKKSDGTPLSGWKEYSDLLLSAFDSKTENVDPIITDDMFKGFNFKTGGLGGVQLKSNDSTYGSAIKLSTGEFVRAYMIQFSKNDLVGTDDEVYKNLIHIFGSTSDTGGVGEEILKTIAVQYALKSNIQSSAITDIIKEVFDGQKVTVYDRRLNDQLGDTWVINWKHSN